MMLKWYNFSPEFRFEYDEDKSTANREKHGIDFRAAQMLWDDEDRVEIPARTTDEPRSMVIGKIGGKHWSCIITTREGRIRIISARRSRKEEVEYYEIERI